MEIFTSASACPSASLPTAPSPDEITSREIDKLYKPRLLLDSDKKLDYIRQLKISAPIGYIYLSIRVLHKTLPRAPWSDKVTSRAIDELNKPRR